MENSSEKENIVISKIKGIVVKSYKDTWKDNGKEVKQIYKN